ncbi:MAG: 5'/3'-nucleotidase SurE, partial [Prevotella sp.]|nr:5'/3'-nucleotidase SurE [Prevotella sp.]
MENERPLILISNDDGYEARGINCLVEMVRPLADVLVCAPDAARSGYACAFSAGIPLTLTHRRSEPGVDVWSCNGTPVDCVKMALAELTPQRRPALVIGGINHGDNASVNTHYSGTMGVTLEGCMKYIPSVAFSLCDHRADADFSPLEPYVRQMVQQLLAAGLPRGVCLNVNFPLVSEFRGVRVCRMAAGTWGNEVM